MQGRKELLFSVIIVLVLFCCGTAFALDSGPGSAADPVFSRSTFHSYVEQFLSGTKGELAALEERLSNVSQEINRLNEQVDKIFPDLKGHWALSSVSYLKEKGIVNGYPDGGFHPKEPVTRAALAVMVQKSLKLTPDPQALTFPDLSRKHWAAGAVGVLCQKEIIGGYNDGTFKPNNKVTRAEASVILYRAFSIKSQEEAPLFPDLGSKHWAASAVRQMAAAGIIGGYNDGTFRPNNSLTRAEAASLLAKILMLSED